MVLESYDCELSTWENIKFIVENEKVGDFVVLKQEEIEEDLEDDKLAWRIKPTVSVENKQILFVFGDLKNTHEKEFVSNWSLKHGAIKILNASLVIRAGDGLSSDRRYSCFSIGQESLVGCGLSRDGHGSNLPDLYSLDLG